ncbi:MAG: hypothetical protein ACLSAF_13910 [Intestinimonas sp.]
MKGFLKASGNHAMQEKIRPWGRGKFVLPAQKPETEKGGGYVMATRQKSRGRGKEKTEKERTEAAS